MSAMYVERKSASRSSRERAFSSRNNISSWSCLSAEMMFFRCPFSVMFGIYCFSAFLANSVIIKAPYECLAEINHRLGSAAHLGSRQCRRATRQAFPYTFRLVQVSPQLFRQPSPLGELDQGTLRSASGSRKARFQMILLEAHLGRTLAQ